MYIDGIRYNDKMPNANQWNVVDSIQLDFLPSVIAIYAQQDSPTFGILATDTAGYDVTYYCEI